MENKLRGRKCPAALKARRNLLQMAKDARMNRRELLATMRSVEGKTDAASRRRFDMAKAIARECYGAYRMVRERIVDAEKTAIELQLDVLREYEIDLTPPDEQGRIEMENWMRTGNRFGIEDEDKLREAIEAARLTENTEKPAVRKPAPRASSLKRRPDQKRWKKMRRR